MGQRQLLVSLFFLATVGCERASEGQPSSSARPPSSAPIVATYKGGAIHADEVLREAQRLPPDLRDQFQRRSGQQELALSMIDKRLLVEEARRRQLHTSAEIAQQVRELEERLIVKALLADEERKAGAPAEAELRAHYDSNKESFAEPERVHVRRILIRKANDKASARRKIDEIQKALGRGESFERLLSRGEGPEIARGGDLGWVARGELREPALDAAAFAATRPGQLSSVLETSEAFVVLEMLERRPPRVPAFEEVRSKVEAALVPIRQRKVFDALRARLRADGDVKLQSGVR